MRWTRKACQLRGQATAATITAAASFGFNGGGSYGAGEAQRVVGERTGAHRDPARVGSGRGEELDGDESVDGERRVRLGEDVRVIVSRCPGPISPAGRRRRGLRSSQTRWRGLRWPVAARAHDGGDAVLRHDLPRRVRGEEEEKRS